MSKKKKRRQNRKDKQEVIAHLNANLILDNPVDIEIFVNNIINPSPPGEKLRNAAEKYFRKGASDPGKCD